MKKLHSYFDLNADADKSKSFKDCPIYQDLSKNKIFRGDVKLRRKDGTEF